MSVVEARPDPSLLTTEQLLRETQSLKELVGSQLEGMEGVFVERFESINTQFQLIERQRVEQKTDTSDAVSAALAAAKEAVTKNEEQTKDALSALQATLTTAIGGLETQLNDLKDRVTKVESTRQGAAEQRTEQRAVGTEKREVSSHTTTLIVVAIAVLGFLGYKATNTPTINVQPPTTVTQTTTTP